MAVIGKLAAILSLNSGQFTAGLTKATRQTKGFGAQLTKTRAALVGFGKSMFAFAGLAAIGASIKSAADRLDALAKTSRRLGIATDQLAGLQLAAELTGVEVRTLNMALQRMVRRVSEAAKGTGEAKNAIFELGLNADRLNLMRPEGQLRAIADRMLLVTNQADRVRIAMRLFDSEGVALVNMLALGSAGLDAVQKKAEDLGIALKGVDTGRIEEMSDELVIASKVMEGSFNQLTISAAPAIAKLAQFATVVLDLGKAYFHTAKSIHMFSFQTVVRGIGELADVLGFKKGESFIGDFLDRFAAELGTMSAKAGAKIRDDFKSMFANLDPLISDEPSIDLPKGEQQPLPPPTLPPAAKVPTPKELTTMPTVAAFAQGKLAHRALGGIAVPQQRQPVELDPQAMGLLRQLVDAARANTTAPAV